MGLSGTVWPLHMGAVLYGGSEPVWPMGHALEWLSSFRGNFFWSRDQTNHAGTLPAPGTYWNIFLFSLEIDVVVDINDHNLCVTQQKNLAIIEFSSRGLGPQPWDFQGRRTIYGRSFPIQCCLGSKFNGRSYCPQKAEPRPLFAKANAYMCWRTIIIRLLKLTDFEISHH